MPKPPWDGDESRWGGFAYHGINLTPDDIEFGKAVDTYKRLHHRPYLTYPEVLAVAKSLGYRKEKPAPGLPPAMG